MTEAQPELIDEVFWLNRSRKPAFGQKVLMAVGLLKPDVVPPQTYLPYGEINSLEDEKLRSVLADQRDGNTEDRETILIPIVFYPDRALSNVVEVRRVTRAERAETHVKG